MNCDILTAADLVFRRESDALFIYGHLTNESSDFNRKLRAWLLRQSVPGEADGKIALVIDHGEVVGWCRTECWLDDAGTPCDTLEAFVRPDFRQRGIAAFAAAGLYAAGLHDGAGTVAVFHPHMLLVARRAGLWPTLYQKNADGEWVQS